MDTKRKCELMRAKKAELRQRQTEAPETVEAGRVVFSGPVFNGVHVVRVLQFRDGRPTFDIEVDGVLRAVKTERGVKSAMLRKISRRCGYGRSPQLLNPNS